MLRVELTEFATHDSARVRNARDAFLAAGPTRPAGTRAANTTRAARGSGNQQYFTDSSCRTRISSYPKVDGDFDRIIALPDPDTCGGSAIYGMGADYIGPSFTIDERGACVPGLERHPSAVLLDGPLDPARFPAISERID